MAARSSPMVQATRSPAIRPTGQVQIDPSRTGEYPVVLGEKLAKELSEGTSEKTNQLYGIRYNYKAKHVDNSSKQKTTVRKGKTKKTFNLNIDDHPDGRDPISYEYRGGLDPRSSASADKNSALALVFDQERQVFVVEPISAELNFNLVSGPGQLRQHPQLPVIDASDDEGTDQEEPSGEGGTSASEDETADGNNPFDYRHFLEHARATTNVSSTPRPGTSPSIQPQAVVARVVANSRTGASGSPAVTAMTKPRGKPITSTASKTSTNRGQKSTAAKSKPAPAPKAAPKSQPLITASDEDSDDEGSPLPGASSNKTQIRAPRSGTNQGFSSPHIMVDEASGLEIDLGSPPPPTRSFGRAIDTSAFASRSPSNRDSESESPAPFSAQASDASDGAMSDIQGHGDSDVPAFTLPSPKADTRRQSTSAAKRVSIDDQAPAADDEDDFDFGAEMERELAQEEEESEVSEEE